MRSLFNRVLDQIYSLLEEDYYRENGYIKIGGEIYEVRFIMHREGVEPYIKETYEQVINSSYHKNNA